MAACQHVHERRSPPNCSSILVYCSHGPAASSSHSHHVMSSNSGEFILLYWNMCLKCIFCGVLSCLTLSKRNSSVQYIFCFIIVLKASCTVFNPDHFCSTCNVFDPLLCNFLWHCYILFKMDHFLFAFALTPSCLYLST